MNEITAGIKGWIISGDGNKRLFSRLLVYESGLIDGGVGESVGQVELVCWADWMLNFKLDIVVSISLIFLMIIPCYFLVEEVQEVP